MVERMGPHVRALTLAQQRVLLAMAAQGPCDAWARAPRVSTLYELASIGLITAGSRGWLDATLTPAGRDMRAMLAAPDDYQEAAE